MVRNEILKLLEAGIIYPVADSQWVSLVHCVPKKGGITVVPNDKDELIPQRIVTGYRIVTPSMRLYLPRVEAQLRGITALKAMSQAR